MILSIVLDTARWLLPLLVISIFLVRPVVIYLYDPLNLRKFPSAGGGFGGITNLWFASKIWSLRRYMCVDEEHRKHGPVVRIQPKHLSFSNPAAAKEIYGHQSSLIKADFYEVFRSELGEENIVGTRDKSEHTRKRKMISAGFSLSNVASMQPTTDQALEVLIEEFDKFAHINQACSNRNSDQASVINLRLWTNYLTFDMIGLAGYSESMGFVRSHSDIAPAVAWDNDETYTVPAIKAFHSVSAFESILAIWPEFLPRSRKWLWWTPPIRNGTAFIDMCTFKLKKRLQQRSEFENEDDGYKDLFGHYVTDRHGKDQGLSLKELITESNVILNAGSDTTATSLCNTLYLLFKHPEALDKLREELDDALPEDNVIPEFSAIQNLPYLQACINESLRLRPPLALGLPRKTVKPVTIAGYYLEAGVTVSAPTWSIHRNECLFSKAHEFNPDRWLGEELPALREYVTPFSQGSRACIGRNLATLELFVCIATLVKRYDIELPAPDWQLPTYDRHVANPGDCPVRIKFRTQKVER